jgi:NADPH:quinone reductase-like Zn-dependent oxidoreductase
MPRPYTPGGEIAGTVLAIGEGVEGFNAGDRVAGTTPTGGLAERALVAAQGAIRLPDAMRFPEGAALIICHGTALYGLDILGKLQPGETLLVTGAAGGIGRAAVELGRALGATVVAAVSSEAKAVVARDAGAHRTVIYPNAPLDRETSKALTGRLKEACGPNGADVIFDVVGGDYSEPALRTIAWGGRFLVIGFPAGIARIPLNLPLLKGCSIIGVFWGHWRGLEPAADRIVLERLVRFYEEGKIRPLISRQVPFEQAADGFRAFSDRSAVGKIVVNIAGENET